VERFIEEVGKLRNSKNKENKNWPDVRLFYEAELLGSGGTLMENKGWVADGKPFFILYGDNLTNVNLSKIYDFHRQHDQLMTLSVFKADEPERCGIVEIDEDSLVVDFVEKPTKPKSNMAAAGIYVADQRIFDFFPENPDSIRPLDFGFHLLPNLVGKMKAYFIEEFLIDIGTPESYGKAQKIYPAIAKTNAD
jgi:mannose-1-phosphate guanylyltransferase